MSWPKIVDLIRESELKMLATQPGGAEKGGKAMTIRDVKECIPHSDELRALLPDQNEWSSKKRKR